MIKFLVIFSLFFSQISIALSTIYVKVPKAVENKDGSVSIVSQSGKLESLKLDLEDLFFEVIQPQDINFTFRIKLAKFGSEFKKTYKNIKLIPSEPYDACGSVLNYEKLKGNVALVIRGDCSFTTKAINVENSGAIAVVVADNDPLNENMIDMVPDETKREVNIPSVYLPWKDGYMIKKSLDKSRTKEAIINIPLNMTFTNTKIMRKRAPWTQW